MSDLYGLRNGEGERSALTREDVLETLPADDGMCFWDTRPRTTVLRAPLGPAQNGPLLRDALDEANAEWGVTRVDERNVVWGRLVDVIDHEAEGLAQGGEGWLGRGWLGGEEEGELRKREQKRETMVAVGLEEEKGDGIRQERGDDGEQRAGLTWRSSRRRPSNSFGLIPPPTTLWRIRRRRTVLKGRPWLMSSSMACS